MSPKKLPKPQLYHHGDLRRAIFNAALEMTAESGIGSLSLREIARRIGVSTAAPYFHFKDRQTLLLEIAVEGYAELLTVLEKARDAANGDADELPSAALAYLSFGRTHRAQYSIMFSGQFAPHPRVGELIAVANRCLDLVRSSIGKTCQWEERQTADAAFCIWSLLHGVITLDHNGVLYESPHEQDRLAVQGVLGVIKGFSLVAVTESR